MSFPHLLLSIITEFTVPAEQFALYETLCRATEMVIEVERVVTHGLIELCRIFGRRVGIERRLRRQRETIPPSTISRKLMKTISLVPPAPETYDDNDLNVRIFADCGGVPEDPATGSSNGCLAAYLIQYDYFDADEIEVTVEQGYEMNRPSLLRLRASQSADGITVEVGGRVLPVLSGQLQ